MEGFFTESVKQVAAHGFGYLLATILSGVAYYFYSGKEAARSEHVADRKAYEERIATLYEKRISEAARTVEILGTGASANAKLADASESRVQALDRLAQSFAAMQQELSHRDKTWDNRASSWERVWEELRRILDDVRANRGVR